MVIIAGLRDKRIILQLRKNDIKIMYSILIVDLVLLRAVSRDLVLAQCGEPATKNASH